MLLDGDGFEHYGTAIANMLDGVVAQTAQCALQTTIKRTGTTALWINNGTSIVATSGCSYRRPVPSGPRGTLATGFGIYWPTLPGNVDRLGVYFLDNAAAVVSCFTFATDGRVKAWRGNLAALLGTTVLPVFSTTAWQFAEFKMSRSSTVGSMALRVDGILAQWDTADGLIENVNTAGTANDYTQVKIGGNSALTFNGAANVNSFYMDDQLIWDSLGTDNNDWIGDQQLIWRPPTADHPTLPLEFVPSTGATLWPLIDESPANVADYISALAADKQAAFDFADLPSDIASVIGVIPYVYAKKLNPGPCTINLGMLSNGVIGDAQYQAVGPDIQMTTADTYWRAIMERNPDTGLPWTPAEINAAYLFLDRTA